MNDHYKPHDSQDTIIEDMHQIDKAIQSRDYTFLTKTHRRIDCKYQERIKNWGNSMWGYNPNFGFDIDALGYDSLIENLEMMKAKLEGLLFDFNSKNDCSHPSPDFNLTVNNNNQNSNTNNNTIDIHISFDKAREQIENMTALSREETDEIINRINELESLSKDKASRKNKWERIKPILKFALDKGIDIALVILTLVVQSGMLS